MDDDREREFLLPFIASSSRALPSSRICASLESSTSPSWRRAGA